VIPDPHLEPSDEALAAQTQSGCALSFEQLVFRFEARIFNYLARIVGNHHEAKDLAQVTFLKAWLGIQTFQSTGSFSAWLFVIAKRTALNHFRGQRPMEPLPEADGLPGGPVELQDPATQMSQKDEAAALWQVARRLKPDQYEVLWLRYGEGFSIAESAKIMKTNPIRIRVLLHRARGHLATLLGESNSCNEPELHRGKISLAPRV